MKAWVRMFGKFEVRVEGRRVEFPTRPTEAVCAFLMSEWGRPVSRPTVSGAVWPQVEPDKAANRLRTSLVYVRQALAPWAPVRTDNAAVSLDTEEGGIDLVDAARLYRMANLAEDPAREGRLLAQLLETIDGDFLAGWEDEWVQPLRNVWKLRRIEAALRLAGIYLEDGLPDRALVEAERALAADDLREETWATYLRVMAASGKGSAAIERFQGARRRRRAEFGLDFSADLVRFAQRAVNESPSAESQPSAAVRDLMARTFTSGLQTDASALVPILASSGFRKHGLQCPAEAHEIMRQAIESTDGTGDERLRVMLFAAQTAEMIDQFGVCIDYLEWIVENVPEDHFAYGQAVNMMGFVNFELREWEVAWRYLGRYRDLAERHGTEMDVATAECQLASLRWHEGDLQGAFAAYEALWPSFQHDETPNGLLNRVHLRANMGFVLIGLHEWKVAWECLEQAHSLAVANGFTQAKAWHASGLALARLMTGGNASESRRLMAAGFSGTFRLRYRRPNELSADYVAAALARLGHPREALRLLDGYTRLRERSFHARSVAEDRFAAWVRELSTGAEAHEAPPNARASDLVARACELLESA